MIETKLEQGIAELIIEDYIQKNKKICERLKYVCPRDYELMRMSLWYQYAVMN